MQLFIGGRFLSVALGVFASWFVFEGASASCLGVNDGWSPGGVIVTYDDGPPEVFTGGGGGLVGLSIGYGTPTHETYKLASGLYIQTKGVLGEDSDGSVVELKTDYLYVGGVSALPSPAPDTSFQVKVTALIGGWENAKQQVFQWSFGPRRPVVIGPCTYFGFDAELSVNGGQEIDYHIFLEDLGISLYIGGTAAGGLLRAPVQIVRARTIG
jgi:hypothetical protein